jgi:hypothetical protein
MQCSPSGASDTQVSLCAQKPPTNEASSEQALVPLSDTGLAVNQ